MCVSVCRERTGMRWYYQPVQVEEKAQRCKPRLDGFSTLNAFLGPKAPPKLVVVPSCILGSVSDLT